MGPNESLGFGNGLALARGYDADGRLVRQSAGAAQSLSWSYDAASNVTALADGVEPTRSQSFAYDARDRLSGARGVYGSLAYGWDAAGNLTSRTVGNSSESLSYASGANRLLGVGTARGFSYDGAGSVTGDGTFTLSYDQAGRPVSASRAGTVVGEYAYDAAGHRTWRRFATYTVANTGGDTGGGKGGNGNGGGGGGKGTNCDKTKGNLPKHCTDDGGSTGGGSTGTTVTVTATAERRYSYDEAGHLLAEADGQGVALRDYVWLDDQLIAVIDAGTPYMAHTDHLGTPVALTDGSGLTVWSAAYRPFGEAAAVSGTVDLPIRFPGQIYDAETGWHDNWHRVYDPALGRYLQSDPIGLRGGINRYAYVGGNPVNRVDPFGLAPGDSYSSQRGAAIDASWDINRKSISENCEYGGMICKNPDGSYQYTSPNKGDDTGVDPGGRTACPAGTRATGYYHSHAGKLDPKRDENFSNADKSYSKDEGVDGYVSTPSGKVKYYNNSTGKISTVATGVR